MKDLIYRQQAIDVASGYCHPANIADELRKLPSAQSETPCYLGSPCEYQNPDAKMPPAQPEWISVEKELPEYGQNVLACYEDGSMGINHVIDEYDEEWFIYWVVAWMPLPEPYQKEGEEHD